MKIDPNKIIIAIAVILALYGIFDLVKYFSGLIELVNNDPWKGFLIIFSIGFLFSVFPLYLSYIIYKKNKAGWLILNSLLIWISVNVILDLRRFFFENQEGKEKFITGNSDPLFAAISILMLFAINRKEIRDLFKIDKNTQIGLFVVLIILMILYHLYFSIQY